MQWFPMALGSPTALWSTCSLFHVWSFRVDVQQPGKVMPAEVSRWS
jgi:hypothetical protein